MASLLYQSTNFLIRRYTDTIGSCTMPLNHSAHAHIAPRYVTTPTWHDYMHGSINLALLSLSLNSWLTKLRVLFVVREGNLWLGLTSQLAESILSAESARSLRSLGWATATDHKIQYKHR